MSFSTGFRTGLPPKISCDDSLAGFAIRPFSWQLLIFPLTVITEPNILGCCWSKWNCGFRNLSACKWQYPPDNEIYHVRFKLRVGSQCLLITFRNSRQISYSLQLQWQWLSITEAKSWSSWRRDLFAKRCNINGTFLDDKAFVSTQPQDQSPIPSVPDQSYISCFQSHPMFSTRAINLLLQLMLGCSAFVVWFCKCSQDREPFTYNMAMSASPSLK